MQKGRERELAISLDDAAYSHNADIYCKGFGLHGDAIDIVSFAFGFHCSGHVVRRCCQVLFLFHFFLFCLKLLNVALNLTMKA